MESSENKSPFAYFPGYLPRGRMEINKKSDSCKIHNQTWLALITQMQTDTMNSLF